MAQLRVTQHPYKTLNVTQCCRPQCSTAVIALLASPGPQGPPCIGRSPGRVSIGSVIANLVSAGGGPCEGDGSTGTGGRADRHVAWTGPASAAPGETWTQGLLNNLAKIVLHLVLDAIHCTCYLMFPQLDSSCLQQAGWTADCMRAMPWGSPTCTWPLQCTFSLGSLHAA